MIMNLFLIRVVCLVEDRILVSHTHQTVVIIDLTTDLITAQEQDQDLVQPIISVSTHVDLHAAILRQQHINTRRRRTCQRSIVITRRTRQRVNPADLVTET